MNPWKTDKTIVLPQELMMVSRQFSPSTGLILLAVYTYYETFGEAMPGSDVNLGEGFGLKSATIKRGLKTLKEEGMVEVSRAGGTRKIKPNFQYPWKETFWEPLQRTWKIIRGEEIVMGTQICDPIAIEVIQYWNSRKGLYPVAIPLNHGDNRYETSESFMKLVKKICALMAGKLFNTVSTLRFYHSCPWTLEEIKQSINNFHLAVTDVSYEPINKTSLQKKRLSDFIYSPFTTMVAPITYYTNPPKPARMKPEEIKFPGLYSSLRDAMVDTFTKGSSLGATDNLKVVIAANRLGELVKSRFQKYMQSNLTSTMWAGYIVECLLKKLRTSEQGYSVFDTMRQGWFWDSAFPQFLMKKGILSEYPLK